MVSKKIRSEKVRAALDKLRNKGIRFEDIAADMHVSYSSVANWMNGRRQPKMTTIQQMEFHYGVKIL